MPGRCGMRWRGTFAARRAETVPGDQPGRTQDTGDRADGTAVRGRAKAQGIEVKHRRRVPAEPLVEFKAATGQQNPGHPACPALPSHAHADVSVSALCATFLFTDQ
jgi:hypothetical protein